MKFYNGENRPAVWTKSTGEKIYMMFDALGRRVEKRVLNAAGTRTLRERYIYVGYTCVQILNGDGGNAVVKEFVWDPTEPVATRPLMFGYISKGLYFFYTVDGNKNVSDVFFFALGNGIDAHYEYAPFGAITRTSSATHIGNVDIVADNPFRFSSEFYDAELDLVYYNYRHYSPALGRFLSRDPIQEQGGLNLYAFVGNNSLKQVDYLGQAAPGIDISIAIRDLIDLINSTRVDNGAAHSYCERYSRYIDATCCRDGVEEQDNYVLKARNMCHDFVNMYSKNGKVIEAVECVAKCLSDAEDESMKISSCEDRNSLRLINHVKCYASCGFFLTDMRYEIGTPPGGWDMGFNEMLPDFIKSLKKRYF